MGGAIFIGVNARQAEQHFLIEFNIFKANYVYSYGALAIGMMKIAKGLISFCYFLDSRSDYGKARKYFYFL